MLHEIIHDNASRLWCGPAALSAVTGKATSYVHHKLRQLSGRKKITGTDSDELKDFLMTEGYQTERFFVYGNPTLAQWLRNRTDEQRTYPMIICVTGHWIVVHGNKFTDSISWHKFKQHLHVNDAPGRRSRVKYGYLIRK